MNKILFGIALICFLPISVLSQNSIFDNSEASVGAIRNLSQYASTGIDAVIYNPAGLAFSEKTFQISLGGIGGYQQIENRPYSVNDNNDTCYDMSHRSSIIRMTPSVQAYYRFGRAVLSFSCANEGGGGTWRDIFGNEVMDCYLREFENNNSEWQNTQLALQQFMVNDEDIVRLYSSSFQGKSNNICERVGITYRLGRHLSGYFGYKANLIGYDNSINGGLYVHRTSTCERWLFSDYIMSTYGLVDNSIDSIAQKINNSITADSRGSKKTWTFAPVIGLGLSYNKFNLGVKYEMSPKVLKENKEISLPHEIALGASYLCFNDKWSFSTGVDFKWGFCPSDTTILNAMVRVSNPFDIKVLYNIVLGADWQVNKRLLASASTTFGNMSYVMRGMGNIWELPVGIDRSSLRFSLGMQYGISDCVKLDLACSMNMFYGTRIRVHANTNFVNSGVQVVSHCNYRYLPRFAAGLGVTYGF